MLQKGFPYPNSFTFSFVLKSCSVALAFGEGKQIHKRVLESGCFSSPFVQASLVNFYSKCEEVKDARKVLDEIPDKNVAAWSAVIGGYARVGLVNEAFGLFREMQEMGIEPDEVTMVSVISVCATSGALDVGRWVHAFIEKLRIGIDLELGTALVNMYAKCGSIERAKAVFDAMPFKDTKAWSSMIVGFAIHGMSCDALETFSQMEKAKVKPNRVSFIGVLSACAHTGNVSDGRVYWSSMMDYGIEPSLELYGCMVDLLCRAGVLEEAYSLTETMHIRPNPVIWRTLLVGCRNRKNIKIGEIAARKLLELEPYGADNHILLSNLYASVSQWEDVRRVRKEMKEKGIKPIPGCSSIEVHGFVHEFVMADWSHAEARDIREVSKDMSNRVSDAGHKPWIPAVLHDVGDEEKAHDLCEHSERLAIAYGLLKTKAPVAIRIVKNLRVCPDCHEVTKIISKLYGREIIVRDRVRFHKFVNGDCSCGDYW